MALGVFPNLPLPVNNAHWENKRFFGRHDIRALEERTTGKHDQLADSQATRTLTLQEILSLPFALRGQYTTKKLQPVGVAANSRNRFLRSVPPQEHTLLTTQYKNEEVQQNNQKFQGQPPLGGGI